MALAAGAHLGPYEILALLGSGGMGEVYKARDTRLDRIVALKTLPSEKIADSERKLRFLEEARAASKLNHPNIVTIYDISEENGVSFIAMEYIAGTTLDQANAGTGLAVKDAVNCALGVADALVSAHSAGIIHRDLKPSNVIVTHDGRIKLLDFGLAKLIEPSISPDEARTASLRTVSGTILGTAPYMSPEQAAGKELDARSDIFSFGLVLYEMLSGKRAFGGDSWISTLAAILHTEPQPLRELNPAIPVSVERHVSRCLHKDPAQRFQTMLEVKEALLQAVSSSGVPIAVTKQQSASVAVLPFVNLSADKENEYFSDGLAEEIINLLSKTPELKVIARTSAFAFRGKEQDLPLIAQRLKVGAILQGSVRRAGNRIRVTVQLIDIADESHLWSERYDREMTDIFAIQDEISQAIASALKVKLVRTERRTENVEAFQSYLKGLYWYQLYNKESLDKAKDAFAQALLEDPGFAPAHAGLAVFYYGLGALGLKRMVEMAPLAKAAASKALAIDPALSEAHSVLGLLAGSVEYDWTSARQYFQTAMAVEPVPPLVRVRYALYFLTPQRRIEEAVMQYQKALENDPLSMMVHFGLAFALYCERRYDDAIMHAAKAVDLYPGYWLVHFGLGLAQSQNGLLEQSIASLERTIELSPSFSLAAAFLAAAHVRSGNRVHAELLMEQLRQKSHETYISPFCFAIYHAALADGEKVFEFLQAAFAERDPYLTRMDAEPYFDPFRSDPRFHALLQGMHLGRQD